MIKKVYNVLLASILFVLMIFVLSLDMPRSVTAKGDAILSITSKNFEDFIADVNANSALYDGETVTLEEDINVNKTIDMITSFGGVFDGNGHTISNVTIESNNKSVGLFGTLSGVVKNLILDNLTINAETNSRNVGSIAATVSSEATVTSSNAIENCYINASITVVATNAQVGGIVGKLGRQINNLMTDITFDTESTCRGICASVPTGVNIEEVTIRQLKSTGNDEVLTEVVEPAAQDDYWVKDEDQNFVLRITQQTPEPAVVKTDVEINILDKIITYGDEIGDIEFEIITENITVQDLEITFDYATHIGDNIISVSSYNSTQYNLTYNDDAKLTINKKIIEFYLNKYSSEFDEYGQNIVITDNILQSDKDNNIASISYDLSNILNVGEYEIEVLLVGDDATDYYILQEDSFTFTVTPKQILVTWGNTDLVYNGNFQLPVFNLALEQGNYQVTGSATNVGQYLCEITSLNDNYEITNSSRNFVISPYQITLNWNDINLVYNNQIQYPTFTYNAPDFDTNLVINQIADTSSEYYSITKYNSTSSEWNTALSKDAGNRYKVTLTSANGNYEFLQNSYEYDISPYTIVVEWAYNSQNDSVENIVFNGNNIFPEYTFNIPSFNTSLSLIEYGANRDVGTYTANLAIDDGNYVIDNATKSHRYQITQLSISLEWSNLNTIYSGNPQAPVVTYPQEFRDELALNIPSYTNVGTYPISLSTNNSNIALSNTQANFVISPQEIEVTWTNNQFTYNGSVQKPSATCALGDLEVIGGQSEIGEYTASVSIDNSNYSLLHNTYDFEISVFTLNIIWQNKLFTYDGETHHPIISNLPSFLGAGDMVYSGIGTDASCYTVSVVCSNTNVVLTAASCDYEIQAAKITVEWSNQNNLVYNASAQIPGYSLTTDIDVDVIAPQIVASGTNVGEYVARIESTNSNYELTNSIKDFRIVPFELMINWQESEFVYNGQVQYPEYYATLPNGSTQLPNYAQNVNYTIQNAGKDAKSYAITLVCDNLNFRLLNNTTSYEIAKYDLAISWGSNSLVYNGNKQFPSYIVTLPNFLQNLNLVTSGEGINVGNYTATISVLSTDQDVTNVRLQNNTYAYSITPYEIEVVWSNLSQDYTGQELYPTFALPSIDLVQDLGYVILGGQIEAGEYTATIQLNTDNFVILNSSVSFVILPKIINVNLDKLEVTIAISSGKTLDNVQIVEVEKESVQDIPSQYEYLYGFEITQGSINTPNVRLTNYVSADSVDEFNLNVTFKLPNGLVLPNDAELFLIGDNMEKLEWQIDNDSISLTLNKLGKVCILHKVEENQEDNSISLVTILCASGGAVLIIAFIIALSIYYKKQKSRNNVI